MDAKVIEVQSVSKSYIGFDIDRKEIGIGLWIKNLMRLTSNKAVSVEALNGVSFHVDRGEILGIYGANGAGKTTLIKLLSGALLPSEGKIKVNGFHKLNEIRNSIGYISTNGWMGLEWQLTARENLILYGNLFGLHGAQSKKACDEILKKLNMYEARNKLISQLSAGMRQKITIARGLLINKPIIYLDEPSVSLDVNAAEGLRELVKDYAKDREHTAIIASHNSQDLSICNRIMLLSHGRVIAVDTIQELGKPLGGVQTIEIRSSSFNNENADCIKTKSGVAYVFYDSDVGDRGDSLVRIGIHHEVISINEIIDYFILNKLPIIELIVKPPTLQEIYEYYLAKNERRQE